MSRDFNFYWNQIESVTNSFIDTMKEDYYCVVGIKDFNYIKWIQKFFTNKENVFNLDLSLSVEMSLVDASLILSHSNFSEFDKTKWLADDPLKTVKIMAVEAYHNDLFHSILEDMHEKVIIPSLEEAKTKLSDVNSDLFDIANDIEHTGKSDLSFKSDYLLKEKERLTFAIEHLKNIKGKFENKSYAV